MTSKGNDTDGSSIAPSSSNKDVRINNKVYGSWKSARAGYLSVTKSVKDGSVWEMIEMVEIHTSLQLPRHHASLEIHRSGRHNTSDKVQVSSTSAKWVIQAILYGELGSMRRRCESDVVLVHVHSFGRQLRMHHNRVDSWKKILPFTSE
jgi:hypothetical protein